MLMTSGIVIEELELVLGVAIEDEKKKKRRVEEQSLEYEGL